MGFTMIILILGLIIFLGIHSTSIINESWRDNMVSKVGKWSWKGLYSLVSITGFILIIWGYDITRDTATDLYMPPLWMQHVSLILLLPVFPLLIAAYAPGRIKSSIHHPMLAATIIWAVAHLLSNGSVADFILFGSFLGWAIADLYSFRYRSARPIPGAPPGRFNDTIALVLGICMFLAFIFWLHEYLIGIPVM